MILTEDELYRLRNVRKIRTNHSRPKEKSVHIEEQFLLSSEEADPREFRVYKRNHKSDPNLFSVGISIIAAGGEGVTLARYNGLWHSHRNKIEGNKLPVCFHIHAATERYMKVPGLDPEGFAEATDRYTTVEGALRCLVQDWRIVGIIPNPEQDPLFPP